MWSTTCKLAGHWKLYASFSTKFFHTCNAFRHHWQWPFYATLKWPWSQGYKAHRWQRAPPLLTRLSWVWQAPLAVSCLVAGGMSCCRCGAFVSLLSEHVSPEQSGGVPLAGLESRIDLQPVVRSCLQLHCSGGTSNLGVDAGLQGWCSSSLHANSLKVGALRVASALVLRWFAVVGTVFSSLVRGSRLRGAYRPVHEDGRTVALKTAWLTQI